MLFGQTWTTEEVHVPLLSEDDISRLLVAAHKNNEGFKMFCEELG